MLKEDARIKFNGTFRGLKHIDDELVQAYNEAVKQAYGYEGFCVENAHELERLIIEGWVEFYLDEIIIYVDM